MPHGRIVREIYTVQRVDEVKCWTIFRAEGSFGISVKRSYTDRDLVSKVVGDQIVVSRIEHPPLPNSLILDVFLSR